MKPNEGNASVGSEKRKPGTGRSTDLVEFFTNSPLREEGMEIERLRDEPREVKLD